jgi:hypothetical protein
MIQNSDPPSIETLLKASNWEDRVAQARVKRAQVLAAKAHAQAAKEAPIPTSDTTQINNPAPTEPSEIFLRRNRAPVTRRHLATVALSILGGIVIGALLGSLAIWVSWES